MAILLGWLGFLLYLAAHGYISLLKKPAGRGYFLANMVAALLMVISSAKLGSWQPVVINMFWLLVSYTALKQIKLAKIAISNLVLVCVLALMFIVGLGMLLFGNWLGVTIWAWSSALAFCLGYWRFSAGRLSQANFFLINAYAATALLSQLYLDQNWPVFFLEIVWALLSVLGWMKLRTTATT